MAFLRGRRCARRSASKPERPARARPDGEVIMIDSMHRTAKRTAVGLSDGNSTAGLRTNQQPTEREAARDLRRARTAADLLPAAGVDERPQGRAGPAGRLGADLFRETLGGGGVPPATRRGLSVKSLRGMTGNAASSVTGSWTCVRASGAYLRGRLCRPPAENHRAHVSPAWLAQVMPPSSSGPPLLGFAAALRS